jgi:DNA-binding response OmpR family regulator
VQKISGVIERPIPIGTRVLVVEDNAPLRDLVRTALELRGAEVHDAATSAEALSSPGPFDVALVDVSLPDGRGDEVIAELRARNAVAAAGLMSGGDLPPNLVSGGQPDGWIRKPFEPEELIAAVKRLSAVARAESKSSLG